MKRMISIALGGFIGGVFRWLLEASKPPSDSFPLTTLLINLIGSFVLGMLSCMSDENEMHLWIRYGVGIGGIGAFTTFSTFDFETFSLMTSNVTLAILYALGSLIGGSMSAYLGQNLALSLAHSVYRSKETER
ncbi:MAG: fluoride efflux transporter CrcB [Alicyclobacillus sp.]|nr:fluoride efflux transporter CrcB [Alicyclobacillus sp.]